MSNVTPLHQDFVPHIQCLELMSVGLTSQVAFFWHLEKGEEPIIMSRMCDPDGLYEPIEFPNVTSSYGKKIPAYTVGSLLHLLHNTILFQHDGFWKLNDVVQGTQFKHESLAILIATVLRVQIVSRRIDLKDTNRALHYSIPYR